MLHETWSNQFVKLKTFKAYECNQANAGANAQVFPSVKTSGIGLVAIGGALLTAPVAVPAAVLTFAEYLTVAGTVMPAVSQTAVEAMTNYPIPNW